ncbi:hypothetical protein DPMN_129479 [Dreissena polymorpha]|uniref:Uncharacterized protein n=1 Tax=Dreissena polymorpha TaxID=45954 RepID=A0A9D4H2Q9_DREPO|nr:hypothetical protein DPMN_129479 [Dreissena polymorpha]
MRKLTNDNVRLRWHDRQSPLTYGFRAWSDMPQYENKGKQELKSSDWRETIPP